MRGTANKFPTTRHYGMHNMRAGREVCTAINVHFIGEVGRGFRRLDEGLAPAVYARNRVNEIVVEENGCRKFLREERERENRDNEIIVTRS